MTPTVSIIIVNYQAHKELFECLTSIYEIKSHTPFEVIVVDNDEKKSIVSYLKEKFSRVIYIPNKNKGFGQGSNLGAKKARGDYIFFLNPDTKLYEDSLDVLISFLKKNGTVGIVAPLLVDKDGKPFPLQGSADLTPFHAIFALSFINKFFPQNKISKKYFLSTWDKTTNQKVSVVPGTAFVISKKLFFDVGGFDEIFFLYFEESDLCKKVKEKKFELYILPRAKVYHGWGKSTQKSSQNISRIFSESKFYYFKKHYGLCWAYLVKLMTECKKEYFFLILILFIGTFLRFYNIQQNFIFDGEVGDNHLDIKNAFQSHIIPLKGPPTSHPWLYFGPLFYWIYEPILILFKFNPVAYGYFGAVIAVAILITNYIAIKRLFSQTAALLSTYLIAISPMYLFTARWSRFFAIVPLLIYPFFILLIKVVKGDKKKLFFLWLLLGIMLQFHYSPLFLIPVIATLFVFKKMKLSIKDLVISIFGFLIPFIPLLIFDSQENFIMTINLLLWIPYRILGFFGLYHKNTISTVILHENSSSILNFFSYSFTPTPYDSFTLVGFLLFCVIVIFLTWKLLSKKVSLPYLLIFIWGFWGFLALFIHGGAPLHYYVPLFVFPILTLSLLLTDIIKNNLGKVITILLLIFLTVTNLSYFFSNQWFYRYTYDSLSYAVRVQTAKAIVSDAHGSKFIIKRIGYYDDYTKNFAQNYVYLLWLYGNEPVEKAHMKYTIIEDSQKWPKKLRKNQRLFRITEHVAVLREDLSL